MKLKILNKEDQCPHCDLFKLEEDGVRKEEDVELQRLKCGFCGAKYEEVPELEEDPSLPSSIPPLTQRKEKEDTEAPEARAKEATSKDAPKAPDADSDE